MTAPETFKIAKTAEAANEAIPRVYDIFSEMSESVNGPPDDARALLAVGDIRAIVRHRNALAAKCEALEREREQWVAQNNALQDLLAASREVGFAFDNLEALARDLEEAKWSRRAVEQEAKADAARIRELEALVEEVMPLANKAVSLTRCILENHDPTPIAGSFVPSRAIEISRELDRLTGDLSRALLARMGGEHDRS